MTDVIIPFKNYIAAGNNTFSIAIPQSWIQNHGFYFEKIFLVPEYYSKQAEMFQLDPDIELLEESTHQIGLSLHFASSKLFFPDPLDVRNINQTTQEFIKFVNQNIETKKPTLLQKIPFFFDYTLTDYDLEISTLEEIQQKSREFYGEAFDETKHYNALPASVQTLPFVNNCKFPNALDEDQLELIRLRIWLAPNFKVTFSNDIILKQMGFHSRQLGSRTSQKQFIITNQSDKWQTLEAVTRPQLNLSSPQGLRITVAPSSENISTKMYNFKISRQDYIKNSTLQIKLDTFLQKLGSSLNIQLGLVYNKSTHMYALTASASSSVIIQVHLNTNLAKRLGFNSVNIIRPNMSTVPVYDQPDLKDIESRSKALVLDCGMVLVCLDNLASTLLVGSQDQIMASLFPDAQGLMTTACSCITPLLVRLQTHIAGPNNTIQVSFNLLRLYESQGLQRFEWTTGAYVYGILRGQNF